jgi:hypothetical protein
MSVRTNQQDSSRSKGKDNAIHPETETEKSQKSKLRKEKKADKKEAALKASARTKS